MQWDIVRMKDGRVLVVSDRADLPPGWREDYRSFCTVNRPEDMPPDPDDTSTWDHYPPPKLRLPLDRELTWGQAFGDDDRVPPDPPLCQRTPCGWEEELEEMAQRSSSSRRQGL